MLCQISGDVQRIVPEIVGVSLSLLSDNLTFTMTASSDSAAELDGVQYLAGGPCEGTLRTGVAHGYQAGDVIDEERWRVFARATSTAGVESTLSWMNVAEGVLMARWGMPDTEAEHRLRQAAERAGIPDGQMARAIIGLFRTSSADSDDYPE